MNLLTEVYEEFASRLSHVGEVVIAGGAVRDFLMERDAKDYDIFILTTDETEEIKLQILEALSDLETFFPVVNWARSIPADKESSLVKTVIWKGVEVQILINPALTPQALVETFDWNICCFAYSADGFYKGMKIQDIGLECYLRLMRDTTPLSTLRRGFRFSERFQMYLDTEDIHRLCQEIIDRR